MNIVGVKDGVSGVCVEVGWSSGPGGRDAAIKHNGALNQACRRTRGLGRWRSEGTACGEKNSGDALAMHSREKGRSSGLD